MARCEKCGSKFSFFANSSVVGELQVCEKCAQEMRTDAAAINAVILTTETAPNLPIVERIEIVTAEVAYGMHIFKDLFADVRDIVGGRSKAVQNTMRDARRTVILPP